MFTDLFEKEDIVASLNRTNESLVQELREVNARQARELAAKNAEIKHLRELLKN